MSNLYCKKSPFEKLDTKVIFRGNDAAVRLKPYFGRTRQVLIV